MPKPLHEQIKDVRAALGLSQQDFAELLGFAHQSTVARIESGEHEPRIATLQKIADATGATFTVEIRSAKLRRNA